MTIIYDHTIGTSRIEVVERWGGNGIILTIDIGSYMETSIRHNLSIAESDKLGAALCKDIIDNYKGHAANLKDKIANLENTISDVQCDNTELQEELGDCRKAFFNLLDERTEYQNTLCIERADHKDVVTKHVRRIDDLQYKNAELGRITLAHDEEHAATITRMQCHLTDLAKKRDEYKEALWAERIEHIAEKRAINKIHHDTHKRNNSIIEELVSRNAELEDRKIFVIRRPTVGDIVNIHRQNGGYWKGRIAVISSGWTYILKSGEVLRTPYTCPIATIKEINGVGYATCVVTKLRMKNGEYYNTEVMQQ